MTPPTYAFLDCGDGRRLERFGDVVVYRPAPGAAFTPGLPPERWREAALAFTREKGWRGEAPDDWRVTLGRAVLMLRPAAQGQIGAFPEHLEVAKRLEALIAEMRPPPAGRRVLNLFAHTGLASISLALLPETGVTHVDAAASAVKQARENAAASGVADTAVRWLVDDAMTFLRREARRDNRYNLVLADPPAFGRSKAGGEWKLERDLAGLLETAGGLVHPGGHLCLTCHREGWSRDDLRKRLQASLPRFRVIDAFALRLCPDGGGRTLEAGHCVMAVRI